MNRRRFVQVIGSASTLAPRIKAAGAIIGIVTEAGYAPIAAPPVHWALDVLAGSLTARGISVQRFERVPDPRPLCIHVGPVADGPDAPENFTMEAPVANLLALRSSGVRGLTYAILELADRVRHSADP